MDLPDHVWGALHGAVMFAVVIAVVALIATAIGCAVSAGGFSLSLLQDASVTLRTGAHDGREDDGTTQPP